VRRLVIPKERIVLYGYHGLAMAIGIKVVFD
jgi:hypothetical protein